MLLKQFIPITFLHCAPCLSLCLCVCIHMSHHGIHSCQCIFVHVPLQGIHFDASHCNIIYSFIFLHGANYVADFSCDFIHSVCRCSSPGPSSIAALTKHSGADYWIVAECTVPAWFELSPLYALHPICGILSPHSPLLTPPWSQHPWNYSTVEYHEVYPPDSLISPLPEISLAWNPYTPQKCPSHN